MPRVIEGQGRVILSASTGLPIEGLVTGVNKRVKNLVIRSTSKFPLHEVSVEGS